MADFLAKIRAVLDVGTVESQIESLTKERQLNIKLNLDSSGARIDKFAESIKNQLKNAGTTAGSGFANSFNSSLGKMNVKTDLKVIENLKANLKGAFNLDDTQVGKITTDLNNMGIAIQNVQTSMRGETLEIKIRGIEETADGVNRVVDVTKRFSSETGNMTSSAMRVSESFKQVATATEQIASSAQVRILNAQMSEWLNNNTNASEHYRTAITNLQQDLNSFSGEIPMSSFRGIQEQMRMFVAESKAAGDAVREVQTAFASMNQVSTLDAKMTSWLNNNTKSTNTFRESVKNLQNDLKRIAQSGKVPMDTFKDFEQRLKMFSEQAKAAGVAGKEAMEKMASPAQVKLLDAKMTTWLNNNTKSSNTYRESVRNLQQELRQLGAAGDVPASKLKSMSDQLKVFSAEAKNAGMSGKSFGDSLKGAMGVLTRYVSVAMVVSKSIQTLKDMARNVVEVDTALTELYRVSNLTDSQYSELYTKMTKSAKDYGTALSDIIDSTASWVRLGFDANIANELAEVTAMYQHVTDLDNTTAVNNLVTAYKGFEDQLLQMTGGDKVESIKLVADVYDKLGNEFAESAADVGDGLSKTASVLAQGGASIQEAAGMFTAINEVLQDSSTSGTALKILTLRIRGRIHASILGKLICDVTHYIKYIEDNYICQMVMGNQRRRKGL